MSRGLAKERRTRHIKYLGMGEAMSAVDLAHYYIGHDRGAIGYS